MMMTGSIENAGRTILEQAIEAVLDHAFAATAVRGARLRVVYAWRSSGGRYGVLEAGEAADIAVSEVLAPWKARRSKSPTARPGQPRVDPSRRVPRGRGPAARMKSSSAPRGLPQ